MMKSATTVLIVESVSDAVKYYAEKLGFDIVELALQQPEGGSFFYGHLKKGKFHLMVRTAEADEMVEFSQIKHFKGRGLSIYVEMKKGLDKYFERCKKKGVAITQEPTETFWGANIFSVRDPFGLTLTFGQPIEGFVPKTADNFHGLALDFSDDEETIIEKMTLHLKGFGISRRPAKKYARVWLKKKHDK